MKRKLLSFALALFLLPVFSISTAAPCPPNIEPNPNCGDDAFYIIQPSKDAGDGACVNICHTCEVWSSSCGDEINLGFTFDG